MLIGLIAILVMLQLFAVNESFKQNTVSTNSAQTNGSIALFSLEREMRMAGYGIADSAALGCGTIQYYYNSGGGSGAYSSPPGPAAGALPPLYMAPAIITQGSGSNPDAVTLMYASDAYRMFPATITATMPSPSAELNVDSVNGFTDGDLMVAVQNGTCALMQVTQVQASALKLQHNPGSSAPFNPAGGTSLLPAFTSGALLYNLGTPVVRTFSISNNNLLVAEWRSGLAGGTGQTLANEVVDLQAEYGLDNGVNNGTVTASTYVEGDGNVDGYTTATPTSALGWEELLAIRVGILARGTYDKPNTSGVCTATTVAPTWKGGTFNVPGGLPSCYHYRVFETVVPLRNMIWRNS